MSDASTTTETKAGDGSSSSFLRNAVVFICGTPYRIGAEFANKGDGSSLVLMNVAHVQLAGGSALAAKDGRFAINLFEPRESDEDGAEDRPRNESFLRRAVHYMGKTPLSVGAEYDNKKGVGSCVSLRDVAHVELTDGSRFAADPDGRFRVNLFPPRESDEAQEERAA